MKRFICLLFIFNTAFAQAQTANSVDCEGGNLETLDQKNVENVRKLASVGAQNVGGIYSSYDYPKLPDNIREILSPDMKTVCEFYARANPTDPFFKDVRENITEKYKDGDETDFFFKYMLTMGCWGYAKNMFDHLTSLDDIGLMFGDIMKPLFDGADPNAFVRIWREGKMYEGPMYIVYDHLAKHYPKSKRFQMEYLPIVKRLKHPRYITKYPKKTLDQIKKEEPDMPITLPMP